MRTAPQAIAAAKKATKNVPGMCQNWTWNLYQAHSVGDVDRDGDADAVDGWKSEPASARFTDRKVWVGAPVAWSGGSGGFGHRAICIGYFNGEPLIRSTDAAGRGLVGNHTLSWFEKNWNLKYLGWSKTISGMTIEGLINPDAPEKVHVPTKKAAASKVKPLPVHGADTSHHNPFTNAQMKQAMDAGLDWISLKATQGQKFIDNKYVGRRDHARKIGLPCMAYHFAETSDPVSQAKHFLKVAGIKPGDMRPMLDLEDYAQGKSFFSKMTIAARTKWVGAFVAVIEKELGVKPFIYTPFALNDDFGCPLWVARYNPRNELPHIPKPWKAWTIRQFTNGQVGVPNSFVGLGHVDLNCWDGAPKTRLKTYTIKGRHEGAPKPEPKPEPVVEPAPRPTLKKTVAILAREVLDNKWGIGPDRVKRLTAAGHDAEAVQRAVNDLVIPAPVEIKPPVAVSGQVKVNLKTVALRVSTANIQNFPDMSDSKTRADIKATLAASDLIFWQELAEAQDHKALDDLDVGFTSTVVRTECPISARSALLKPVGAPIVTKISDSLGAGSHSPARYMTEQRYTWSVPTGLPDVWSIGNHYVNSAWNAKRVPKKTQRKLEWKKGHAVHQKHALAALANGFIVIGGGDYNRSIIDTPSFHPRQKWVVGGKGIDGVYVIPPLSVNIGAGASTNRNLNSDHNLRTVRLSLSAR